MLSFCIGFCFSEEVSFSYCLSVMNIGERVFHLAGVEAGDGCSLWIILNT